MNIEYCTLTGKYDIYNAAGQCVEADFDTLADAKQYMEDNPDDFVD